MNLTYDALEETGSQERVLSRLSERNALVDVLDIDCFIDDSQDNIARRREFLNLSVPILSYDERHINQKSETVKVIKFRNKKAATYALLISCNLVSKKKNLMGLSRVPIFPREFAALDREIEQKMLSWGANQGYLLGTKAGRKLIPRRRSAVYNILTKYKLLIPLSEANDDVANGVEGARAKQKVLLTEALKRIDEYDAEIRKKSR